MITLHSSNLYETRKDKKLMRILFSLTLRGYSEMRFALHSIGKDESKNCAIILARNNNKVVGWALIYPFNIVRCAKPGTYAHFYVARTFRRKGIGTMLYNKAKEDCGENILCSAWDEISSQFFTKNKAKLYGDKWQDSTSSNLMDIFFN